MFEHLDDPSPPTFGSSELNRIARRCEARHRRTRVGAISAVTVPSLVIGGVLLGRATADAPERVVTTQPEPEPVTTPAPTTVAPTTVADTTTVSSSTTIAETEPEFPLLGDRTEALRDDEWLIPLDVPDGFELRQGRVRHGVVVIEESGPRVDESVSARRQLEWGRDGEPFDRPLTVEVSSDPLSSFWAVPGSESVEREVAGLIWEFFGTEDLMTFGGESELVRFGPLEARRTIGDTTVFVRISGDVSDADWLAAIESLAVVPRSVIDVPILDLKSPGILEVAAIDFDGVETTLGVERFEGTSCFYVTPGGPSDIFLERCLPDLVVDGVMSEVGFPSAHHPGGSSTLLEVQTFGMVRSDVVSVELVMFNDEVVTLMPTGVDGMSEKFWLLADSFEIGQRLDLGEVPVFLPPTIQSITAYDVDGNVLAVDVADDWRDDQP